MGRGAEERIYVSTNAFERRGLAEILDVAERQGIGGLELSALEGWDQSLVERAAIRRYLVHNYFPPPPVPFVLNLASADAAALTQSIEHCRRAIDLSATLRGPVYAAHAGFTRDLAPRLLGNPTAQATLEPVDAATIAAAYERLVESVKSLTAYAAARGVRFLIENHVLSPLSGEAGRRLLPMVTAEELVRLHHDVGDASFGVLIDVGHLNVSARAVGFDRDAFMETVLPIAGAFHLSDNGGCEDEHRPFGADAWFLPYLRQRPDVPITIELSPTPIGELLRTRDVVAHCA